MADNKTDDPLKYLLQVAIITLLHPMKGDKITRNFIGKAFMEPDLASQVTTDHLVVGQGKFSDFMRLDLPTWEDDFDSYMQTAFLTIKHPESGQEIERSFVGKAFFTPDELDKFGSLDLQKIFWSIDFRAPYNPYEDEDNVPVHRHKTDVVRQALVSQNS